MLKPTETEIRAMSGLLANSNFDIFVEWLRNSAITQAVSNCKLEGERAIKGAGGVIELQDLLSHINKTPEYIANFRETKKKEGL